MSDKLSFVFRKTIELKVNRMLRERGVKVADSETDEEILDNKDHEDSDSNEEEELEMTKLPNAYFKTTDRSHKLDIRDRADHTYVCPICITMVSSPVKVSCGHYICAEC